MISIYRHRTVQHLGIRQRQDSLRSGQTLPSGVGEYLGARLIDLAGGGRCERAALWRCERKRFPGLPEQVGQARRFIREALGEDFSLIEDAVLIVSELATNAIIRAMSQQEGSFEVAFLRCHGWALITVSDQGSAALPYQSAADPDEGGSRSQEIVDALALRWGFIRDHSQGGLTWCELGQPDHRLEAHHCS